MVKVTATIDTWVDQGQPSARLYNKTGYVAASGGSRARQGFVWVTLPMPKGATILRATLRLYSRKNTHTGNHVVSVAPAIDAPSYYRTTWNNRTTKVGPTTTLTKSGALTAAYTAWDFNVTSAMQQLADGVFRYTGWRVTSTDVNPMIFQAHYGQYAPYLEVTWTTAPDVPAWLAPSAAHGVSVAGPVLRWNWDDTAGDITMQAYRVQFSDTADFSSPIYDTGAVTSSHCQHDCSADTRYPALAEGGLRYWRVCNQDGDGLWSGWSKPTSYRYCPLPTLTMVNPTSGDVLDDPTPPIDWTFTPWLPAAGDSANQDRYAVSIWEQKDGVNWTMIDRSGTQAGATSRWYPNYQFKATDNRMMRVIVDVYDGRAREAVPNGPIRASQVTLFTFKSDGTIQPVSNLAAKVADPYPGVTLTWYRATQPDEWRVYRDGMLLTQRAGDGYGSGPSGNYTVTDRYPDPRVPHTWSVRAVVNGKMCPDETVVATNSPVGTWLCSPDGAHRVCLVNDKGREVTFGEESAVHYLLGSTAAVVITQAQRGYEGKVVGEIRDVPGVAITIPQAKADVLWFKENQEQQAVLLMGDQSMRVSLANINLFRSTAHPGAYSFSADFYQQQDLEYDPEP